MRMRWCAPTWIGLLLMARASVAADSVSLAPANWDRGLKLAEAHDHNPDPKIVEVDLTARIADVEVHVGRR